MVLAQHGKRSAVDTAIKQGQEQATRARALASKLFGAEGLAFTQQAYPEQAESMGEILRLIDQDGLGDELDALLGPQLLVALRACQAQYEAMVETRMTRDDRKSTDLARLRGKLQRAIARYSSAVLTLLDESEPSTLTLVLTALRPFEIHRAQQGTSKATGAGEDAPVSEADEETAGAAGEAVAV